MQTIAETGRDWRLRSRPAPWRGNRAEEFRFVDALNGWGPKAWGSTVYNAWLILRAALRVESEVEPGKSWRLLRG